MSHYLAIITVVYENYPILVDFFKSLKKQSNHNFHLFIADLSKNKKPLPSINSLPTTIISAPNKGYAHGVNIALQKSKTKGFCLYSIINNDTIMNESFVESSLISLRKHPKSLIGGKIYYAPGYEYHKIYQANQIGKVIWYAGGRIDWNNAQAVHRGVDEVDKKQYELCEPTDFITGCLMLYDKTVLDKVGYWDESYFLYYEDADFCERAKRKNIDLWYDPKIYIWHKNAQSSGGSGSNLQQRYQKINQLKFGLKYAPWRTKIHLMKNFLSDALAKK